MSTEKWEDKFLLVEEIVQQKTIVTAIDFTNIEKIRMVVKTTGPGSKRSLEFIFKDGRMYEVPEDSKITQAPASYHFMVNEMAKRVKV